MVDSVTSSNSSAAISALLRAQSSGSTSLKPNAKTQASLIDQLQKTPQSTSNALSTQTLASASAQPSSNLPRGSLVDIVA